jgi:hypothetical protein
LNVRPLQVLDDASVTRCRPDKTICEVFMKVTDWVRLLSIFLWAAANVSSGQVQAESQEQFICTSGAVKRVVRIVNRHAEKEPGGCRVDYIKDGKTNTVWSSKSGYAYCVAKAVSLVTKLGQGNFSCKPEAVQPDEGEPPQQAPAPSDTQ